MALMKLVSVIGYVIMAMLMTIPLSHSSWAATATCDKSLWQHVFLPARLHVVNQCMTVTGILKGINPQQDGDIHIRVLPDDHSLVNQINIKQENGELITEAICQSTPLESRVGNACDNFNHAPLKLPPIDSRVAVTGSYVLDTAKGWMEIHPITSIIQIH